VRRVLKWLWSSVRMSHVPVALREDHDGGVGQADPGVCVSYDDIAGDGHVGRGERLQLLRSGSNPSNRAVCAPTPT
jgi:hypothetical protein